MNGFAPPVLFDGTHLWSADLDALHTLAEKAGLKREWFQDNARHPHYDVTGASQRRKVLAVGVVFVGQRCLVNAIRLHRQHPACRRAVEAAGVKSTDPLDKETAPG